ncbi:MAG: glycerate 2-kinase, hydroxypyruvate reductase [candidate division NC10 bacterium CSP1-5]|nr:MAG: glycerate 2-kinase, hydroxypyruvate reductase [candidate division NC10 bacterium CSP1-5]
MMSGPRGTEDLRKAAGEIFQAALDAANPRIAIHRHVRREGERLLANGAVYDLSRGRVYVVGAGKACAAMAAAVEEVLGDRIRDGVVVVKDGYAIPLRRIRVTQAGHPVPDARGAEGTSAILALLTETGPEDLVIVLISGGGSALLPAPVAGIDLIDKQTMTRVLLACGATIEEINAVRKHCSRIKGGQMARALFPARSLTLILSDVIGDPVDAIASGPTVPDTTTYGEALEVLRRYRIEDRIPVSILRHLERGARGEIPETPKAGDPCFATAHHRIVGNNLQSLLAARDRAARLGFQALILTTELKGESREVAKVLTALLLEMRRSGHPVSPPACLLLGGETTVTVRGKGKGGRSQELVLAGAIAIAGGRDLVIWSAGTDGTDGPTDAAGAVADGDTWARAKEVGLDPLRALEENDAYHFFEGLGDLIKTGPTLTNVMDILLLLAG